MDDREDIFVDTSKAGLEYEKIPADHGTMQRHSYSPARANGEDVLIERRDFRIRVADTQGRRSKVGLLIERMYSWRGYQTTHAKILSHSPNQITLVASKDEHLFGTITVGLDSPYSGLQADELYGDELGALRSRSRKLCECTKLAVDRDYSTKEALAALMNLAIIYAFRITYCDDMLIEVNPRHAGYYKRMLGFVQAGPERTCDRVGAPAVLLRLTSTYATEQIDRHGGHQTTDTKSLYPYFFSKREEEGLCARLRGPALSSKMASRSYSNPPIDDRLPAATQHDALDD
jgi:hypothetical protein